MLPTRLAREGGVVGKAKQIPPNQQNISRAGHTNLLYAQRASFAVLCKLSWLQLDRLCTDCMHCQAIQRRLEHFTGA